MSGGERKYADGDELVGRFMYLLEETHGATGTRYIEDLADVEDEVRRRCNSHDELVEALAGLLDQVDYGRYGADAPAVDQAVEAYQDARAALSRARGES